MENDIILFNNDCIVIMKELINKNIIVDSIISDSPYNISKKNNFSTMKNTKRQGIDFGEWDKNVDLFSWLYIEDKLLKNDENILLDIFLNLIYENIVSKISKLTYNYLLDIKNNIITLFLLVIYFTKFYHIFNLIKFNITNI